MARRVCRNVRALPLGQAVAAYNAQRGPAYWVQTRNELVGTCKKKQRDDAARPLEDV
jgi:hypothetical protein